MPEVENVIEVSGLTRRFKDIVAVDGIDFEVPKGTIYALLGPNGAGKSTTVKMLEGLLKKGEGKIFILGLDPWKEHGNLKWKIGVMPQEFNFFEQLSPREAISFYSKLFGLDVDPDSLLKLVLLESSADVLFEKLSGGQKQKLGLALSLVNDPEILFLDEPTTGLDPSARRAIWGIIRSFKEKGKTIVLTTHYLEEAEMLADFVSIINKGRIIASGSPEHIVEAYGSGRKLVLRDETKMAEFLESKGVPLARNGTTMEIPLPEGTSLLYIISLIENSGIGYSQITVRTDSLEDVFVKIVGRMSEGELS